MNIFWLDNDLKTCAKYHNDKHCVKMILEYAQLLSTAHHILGSDVDKTKIYKATHINHPCAIWVRESKGNYATLSDLLFWLGNEYTFRYGKFHKTMDNIFTLLRIFPNYPSNDNTYIWPGGNSIISTRPLCMPDEYKIEGDPIQSYRNYYIGSKQHIANWKNRSIPNWFILKEKLQSQRIILEK